MRSLSLSGSAAGFALLLATGCGAPESSDANSAAETANEIETEIVSAIRQDVVETRKAEASVGGGSVISLPLEVEGIVTWAPKQGDVLASGDTIVEVGGRPIVLVVGESPLYRPLRLVTKGERDEAGFVLARLKGSDVAQLQQFLLDEGFNDRGRLKVDEQYGTSTRRAVKDWQTSVGHPPTGVIDASQMVFMPNRILVESDLSVGATFEQFDVTGTSTVLEVNGSTALREYFTVGSKVEVLSEPAIVGEVTHSSRATADGEIRQLIEIEVPGTSPEELGQSVQVEGSVTRSTDSLTVPVRALLANSDGGWRVEISTGDKTEKVSVELDEVFGTTAIVSGIEEGEKVVVPL